MFQLLKIILYTIYNHSTPRTEDEAEIKIRRIILLTLLILGEIYFKMNYSVNICFYI